MKKEGHTLSSWIESLLMQEYMKMVQLNKNTKLSLEKIHKELHIGTSLFLNHFEDPSLSMIMRLQTLNHDINLYGLNLTDKTEEIINKEGKQLSNEEQRVLTEKELTVLSELSKLRDQITKSVEAIIEMED